MRNNHDWAEMLPEEFLEEKKRAPVVYLACGGMEEHGLYNPLGVDYYIAREVCLKAVNISGGILFPAIPFVPAYIPGLSREELRARSKELYSPSLWVSREICKGLYIETMESMADLGFKVCIAFSGHLPAEVLLEEIEKEKKGCVGEMKFLGTGIRIIKEVMDKNSLLSGHGMMAETSIVMAISPTLIKLPRLEDTKESRIKSQTADEPPAKLAKTKTANRKFGERLIDQTAKHLAEKAQRMLSL